MVVERATTAKRSHSSSPSTSTTSISEEPRSAATASATSTAGMDRRVVMPNTTKSSILPP